MLQIHLKDSTPINVEAVVRTVPHQREVVRGTWQNELGVIQNVYAKKFTGTRAAQHFARDLSGVTDLLAAKIPTPALLFQGLTQDNAHILVFAAIPNTLNAEEVWQNLNAKARFELAKNLVKTVAQLHNAGILQNDLYLKNFLVDGDIIYTLDGDGISQYIRLSQQKSLANLSVLLSKFDVLDVEAWLADLLKIYAEERSWLILPDAALIKGMTNAHRQKVSSKYADKKVFRQCTDVNIAALEGLYIAASSGAIKIKNLQNIERFFSTQKLLKNGKTCTVALAEINGEQVVIKRYNIKSFWHGLSRALRQTRAAVSWANAHRLKLLDIATAQPIALIEHRKYGVKGKAYFLAEYIDAPDATQFFAETSNKAARAEVVKNIAHLFYRLYLLKISHGDMKATNIKIADNKPVLIDLDSMRQHQWSYFAQKAHVRDLKRFMQNWQNDNALYNAFVQTFNVVYEDHTLLIKAGIATNKELVIE